MPKSTKSKRTCLGRTGTFKRCRNSTGLRRRFCQEHRYQPWVFLFLVLGFAGVSVGLYRDAFKPLFIQDSAEQMLARMDEERARLQAELEKEKERSRKFVGGVGVSASLAGSFGQSNPTISALAEALAVLIEDFDAEVDLKKLSEADDLRFRLSKATLANAQHRYTEVPTLLPVEEAVAVFQAAKKQMEHAETQKDRAIDVNQVLGDGFYELREWRQALACYERVIELRPDRWATREGGAICLLKLGRLSDASVYFGEMVAQFTALVEQEGRTELANDLASSLTNRAGTLLALERLDDAVKDFDKAIEVSAGLVEPEARTELADDLAKSLNKRANTLSAQRNLDDAIKDYDKAIEIRTRLLDRIGGIESAENLAASLNNRGNTLHQQGNLDDAIKDRDQAIEIYARLVEQDGRSELTNELAASLTNRGGTLHLQGKLDDAIKDYDMAIEIYSDYIEREGRTEFLVDLVSPLLNRGLTLRQQGKSSEAADDVSKAVGILDQLVSQGRSDLEVMLREARRILTDLEYAEAGE